MKRQSIVGSEVLSIDIELVSSVDVLRKRLLGSDFDASVDQHNSSPLSIISAIRSAQSFANGFEKHLLHTLNFLTPSEK
ncbi:hypothetical protein F2Q70_00030468 [Brassica cretica]|uniref:Uncharacterized protein n=1 Tax=Brassica cretica TaxID=69181 RepID=A0A8S9FE87_BRACR|nr:hypothetical protein F2Q70_00030468 [Brassica cretica]KAF2552404.1 hypothetical protein F2Q68_00034916 [Brassica cretica]